MPKAAPRRDTPRPIHDYCAGLRFKVKKNRWAGVSVDQNGLALGHARTQMTLDELFAALLRIMGKT
jgi:hypothetical protein